ncbi:YceD family protein [Almyronema epifaneia]|uniref:YceD family protein n=1 Tax=Almyronema epifaneia S1 TaxID=2991925 RepID=A0ABW6IBF3_9CYAN
MEAIYIPQLTKAPDKTLTFEFREHFDDLETLTPVKGELQITHHGNFLEVQAQAEAIKTLTCYRCLQNYNHRIVVEASELVWLEDIHDEAFPLEREVTLDDLVETLSPQGYFYPSEWLYQQLCLAMPQRQLCDRDCEGIPLTTEAAEVIVADERWSALAALKQQLPNFRAE